MAPKTKSTPEDYGIENYTWNDGKLDVNRGVNLSNKGLTKLPFKFGVVKGYFYCDNNQLTSLQGAPEEVGGYFSCGYNRLTSLQGAPERVGGDFVCSNKLPTPELLATLDDPLLAYALMKKTKISNKDIPVDIKKAWKDHLSGMDQLEIVQEYAKYGLKVPKKYQKATDPGSDDSDGLLNILEDLAK